MSGRVEGGRGNREVSPLESLGAERRGVLGEEGGYVGETLFPLRDRAEGEGGGRVKYLLLPLRLFQAHGVPGAPTCRYHPSCSQYAADALRKHGPVRGSLKAGWRFLRCNPWSHGGVDHA